MIKHQLYEELTMQLQQTFDRILNENHPENGQHLHQLLQILRNEYLYRDMQSIVQLAMQHGDDGTENIQKNFLSHLQEYMNIIGLNNDKQIRTSTKSENNQY